MLAYETPSPPTTSRLHQQRVDHPNVSRVELKHHHYEVLMDPFNHDLRSQYQRLVRRVHRY